MDMSFNGTTNSLYPKPPHLLYNLVPISPAALKLFPAPAGSNLMWEAKLNAVSSPHLYFTPPALDVSLEPL